MAKCEEFFEALWNKEPFPWQKMLAERVSAGSWPECLDLPTASGKTACIDIAVWALAAQADRPLGERTAPRRIWFVVDRRIVVDEAFERAKALAERLATATGGPLQEIADRLRSLSGTDRPLAVARLRGGILLDDGWARLPSQPAVITSTVDQLGSRLLFRSYGHSDLAAPIFAGLAANDSLILLDEAHCAVPFLQTLRAVARYRKWAEEPLPLPFAFVLLSATPPEGIPPDQVFPGAERERALDHPALRQRLEAHKPAELVTVSTKTAGQAGRAMTNPGNSEGAGEGDPFIEEVVCRALQYLKAGKRRVAVMVNRVQTAYDVAAELRTRTGDNGDNADIVLLTGRLRPYERDRWVEHWKPFLRADCPEDPPRPIVVVSTQCLEVGADFSFDALVTEAASLDALRQRFGRLDRMGTNGESPASILFLDRDTDPKRADPIYGGAIAATWQLLGSLAQETGSEPPVVDFGFEALRARLADREDLASCLAPAGEAPILMPAHLDLLCQTSPAPHPDPDVELFLHGKDRSAPEVRVAWRADLLPQDTGTWVETVALCPPISAELLSVPLHRLKKWLAAASGPDTGGDVEGVPTDAEDREVACRPVLLWRGRDRSLVARHTDEIRPGNVVVMPASYGIEGLGQSAPAETLGEERLDLWEVARATTGQPPAIRIHRAVLQPWLGCEPLAQLVRLAEEPEPDRDAVREAIEAVLQYRPPQEAPAAPPAWWVELLRQCRTGRMETHPAGGLVLFSRARVQREEEPDLFADEDDLTSAAGEDVTLEDHTGLVARTVEKLAALCLPDQCRPILVLAAQWHDAGKLDPRFQVFLHHGDELAAVRQAQPIAKSAAVPVSPALRRSIREASGLPQGFRHEFLSVQLAQHNGALPKDAAEADLFIHLVESHHGYARPWAPVCIDLNPPGMEGQLLGQAVTLPGDVRTKLTPPHHPSFGSLERFWRLTRRFGWWGLAYVEAVLRLGDWYASGRVSGPKSTGSEEQARV